MKHKIVLALAFVMSLLLAVTLLAPGVSPEPTAQIYIKGNSELVSQAQSNNWTGSGSESDPYILYNLTINANGYDYGIYIADTSLYFIILDSWVEGAAEASVCLYNVNNGRVENTTCLDSGTGISLISSSNTVLSNVSVQGGLDYGIYLSFSNGNTIADSTVSRNGVGICLWSSGGNTIRNDNVSDNLESGVRLVSSSDNLLDSLECSNNSISGLDFTASRNNVVNNSRAGGSLDGIVIESSSHGNTVSGSNLSLNFNNGIRILESDRNTLRDNRYGEERFAINITDSAWGMLYNNTMYNCSILLQGDQETFTTQTISLNNTVNGRPVLYVRGGDQAAMVMLEAGSDAGEIILGGVNGAEITDRSFDNASVAICMGYNTGIQIRDSSFDKFLLALYIQDSRYTLVDNITGTNSETVIFAWRSHDLSVANSGFSYNLVGARIYECERSTVSANTFSANGAGLVLAEAAASHVENANEFDGNAIGMLLGGSHDITVRHNTFHGDGTGIDVGISLAGSRINTIEHNGFNGVGTGILVNRSINNKILSNDLRDGGIGVYIAGPGPNTVSNNTCRGNDVGVKTEGSSGTVIENNRDINENGIGIFIESGVNEKVLSNTLTGNDAAGIKIANSSSSLVLNNTCAGSKAGISIVSSQGIEATRNTCIGNEDGIWVMDSSARLDGNTCSGSTRDNTRGIMISYSQGVTVEGGLYDNNRDGIHLSYSSGVELRNLNSSSNYVGIILRWSDNNVLENVTCGYNSRYGIGLEDSDNNRINGSKVYDNQDHGVGLRESDHNDLTNNTLEGNHGHGVFVWSGSENRFLNNAFLHNNDGLDDHIPPHVQAYDDGTSNQWNTEGRLHNYGNHWSEWTSDGDGNGIADRPYVLGGSGGAVDRCPLIQPHLRITGAPRDLAAESGNKTVVLTWKVPSDTGGAPILNYIIYRENNGTVARVAVINPELTYIDHDVVNGLNYTYWISASNLLDEGPRSLPAEAHPASVPFSSTNITAMSNTTAKTITLNWTVPEDGGANISGYHVYRGLDAGNFSLLFTVTNGTTYNDTDTLRGVRYYYYVVAFNVMGNGSRSEIINCTVPPVPPDAPRNLTTEASDSSVRLTWEAPEVNGGANVTEYAVYRRDSSGTVLEIGSTTGLAFMDNNAVNGITYYYWVKAKNSAGEGAGSTEVPATPMTVPGTVTGLTATRSGNTVVLSWSAPSYDGGSPIIGYHIYRGLTSSDMELISSSSAASYSDNTVTSGIAYYYRVAAINSVGEGEMSLYKQEKNTKTLPGKVVDADNNPVPNATVIIDGREYTTDENGLFVAEVQPGAGKTITIRAPGMEDLTQTIDVPLRATDLGSFQMEAGSSEDGDDIMGLIWIPVVAVVALVSLLVLSRLLRRDRKARKR